MNCEEKLDVSTPISSTGILPTSDPVLTSKDQGCVRFWNSACAEESKQLWLRTEIDSVVSDSTSSSGSWENITPNSWFSIKQRKTHMNPSQKTSWQSSRCFQLAHMVCESTNAHLKKSLDEEQKTPEKKKKKKVETAPVNGNNRRKLTQEKKEEEKKQKQQAKVAAQLIRKAEQAKKKQQRLAFQKLREENQELYKTTKQRETWLKQETIMLEKATEETKKEYELLLTEAEKIKFMVSWARVEAKKRKSEATNNEPLAKKRKIKCKEAQTLYPERERTLPEVVEDLQSDDLELATPTGIFTYKYKLRPTNDQKTMLRSYMGAFRFVYNQVVATHKDKEFCKTVFGVRNPPSQDVREHIMKKITDDVKLAWVKNVPYNLRELAPREYDAAVKTSKVLHPDGEFEMSFKSIKKSRVQTIPLGSRCLFFSPDGIKLFPSVNRDKIPFKCKKQCPQIEALCASNNPKSTNGVNPDSACKLVYDRGQRSYEIHVPMKRRQYWTKPENQRLAEPRVIALDPGVRTFLTGYSPNGLTTEFAAGDAGRLGRLSAVVDKLSAEIDKDDVLHHKRSKLRRKRFMVYSKLQTLVSEVHWKSADHLCKNYDVILLPTFGTQSMVQKGTRRRKMNRSTARKMLLWSHYRFRQRLLFKTKQWGRTVVVVNEAYTSKTCTRCGWQHHTLGNNKVFTCQECGLCIDRDLNGGRNILLRNIC